MSDTGLTGTPASSLIRDNQFLESRSKDSIVKALRAVTGQFKVQADTASTTSTFVTEPEFSFPIKAGISYVLDADLNFRVGQTSVPAGGLKIKLVAPADSITAFEGSLEYFDSGPNVNVSFLGTAADTPYTGMLKGVNNSMSLYTGQADLFAAVHIQAVLQSSKDDVLTLQFAQVVGAVSHPTNLMMGSSMALTAISAQRKSPNVV